MQKYNLKEFVGGWLVGNFEPAIFRTEEFEVSVKRFKSGQGEPAHFQKIATEITVIIEGTITMNNEIYGLDEVVVIKPNEVAAFKSITDSVLVCIKFPSSPQDKIVI
jgi:quercetin dioxygenase-like cupin family protein